MALALVMVLAEGCDIGVHLEGVVEVPLAVRTTERRLVSVVVDQSTTDPQGLPVPGPHGRSTVVFDEPTRAPQVAFDWGRLGWAGSVRVLAWMD